MNVGNKIQIRLTNMGLSQNDLAKKACMSQSGLSSIVNGHVSPKVDTLEVIANALDCSICDLLEIEAPKNKISFHYSPAEIKLIENFRSLNQEGKEFILQAMAMAVHSYISEQSDVASDMGISAR